MSEIQTQRLYDLEKCNIEYEKKINEWKVKTEKKTEENVQMKSHICELCMIMSLEYQEEMIK